MEQMQEQVKTTEKELNESSGQDGSIGRNTTLPHTTKRIITTNFKTKNNQNCQKIICIEVQKPRN